MKGEEVTLDDLEEARLERPRCLTEVCIRQHLTNMVNQQQTKTVSALTANPAFFTFLPFLPLSLT